MHHMTKKSLLTKYEPMVEEGKSAVEIKNAIVQNEGDKALTMEEVDEVVLSLFDDLANKENQPTADSQAPSANNSTAAVAEENSNIPKGKVLYDIYQGTWWPIGVVTGHDNKEHVVEWEFRPEGNPKMTNVPCEPRRAEEFNAGKRLRAAKVPTEQMIEVGKVDKKVLDKLPNPNEVRRINS